LRPVPQDSHGDIIRIAQEHSINIYNMQAMMRTVLVRPNVFQHTADTAWVWGHGQHWIESSTDEKKHHLKLHDIALDDYITSNHTISL